MLYIKHTSHIPDALVFCRVHHGVYFLSFKFPWMKPHWPEFPWFRPPWLGVHLDKVTMAFSWAVTFHLTPVKEPDWLLFFSSVREPKLISPIFNIKSLWLFDGYLSFSFCLVWYRKTNIAITTASAVCEGSFKSRSRSQSNFMILYTQDYPNQFVWYDS